MNIALKETLDLAVTGQIWRIYYDQFSNNLLVEIRKATVRQTSFIIINLDNGKYEELKIKLENNWWIGVCAFKMPYLIINHYPDPALPESKGVICYSCNIHALLWQHLSLHFVEITDHFVIAFSKDSNKNFGINLETGLLKEIDDNYQENPNHLLLRNLMVNPVVYQDNCMDFSNIAEFIKKKLSVVPRKAIEYLEFTQYIIISFYIYGTNDLVLYNTLVVYSRNGELLLKVDLAVDKKGVGENTFTVFNTSLVFIKNTNQIAVYELG